MASTTRDIIIDFSASSGDKIDLLGVDANTALAGNQALSYAEFAIVLTGVSSLSAANFVL